MANVLLTIQGNTAHAQAQIGALTSKVDALVAALGKASATTAVAPKISVPTTPTGGAVGAPLTAGQRAIDSAIKGMEAKVASVTKTFQTWQRSIQNVGDSLRLLSQGISTVGRVMTMLVSAPLGLFMKNQAAFAIEFEDALTRVRKVAGYTLEQTNQFKEGLRALAVQTATSHTDLLGISEVIAQMGVTSIDAILDLTRIFNMFSISTGIAADVAATNLGRISNAFGWNLNASTVEVEKFANVLNKLENTNAATAGQIMRGVAGWSQQAALLGINADAAAGLTTTLIAMGMSENEAGTAMRRATAGLIEKREAVASSMAGIEGYSSATEVLTAINEDALAVMLDIIDAASNGSNKALALAEMLEIGGARGGRALATLANNTELLRRNLAIANMEWDLATSLMVEYELAMTSTKNQMGLLKNNINDVGITLGDALLPTINQLIMVLVPALQMFNEWFRSLDDGKKRMIIFGAMALVALGPALFIFGQLANAASLVVLGLGRVIMLVPQLMGGFLALLKPVLMVGRAFLSWPGMVILAIVGILKVLQKMGVDVAGFFVNIGNAAKAWGERLAQTYAGGFIAGAARYIAAALQWVANLIASFFRGASPPKKGPLSTIDKWGSSVMEAYLEGFKKADFSILSEIGSTIEQVLTRGLEGEKLAEALQKVAGARMNLANLIDNFNETGIIDEGMLNKITKGLGPLRDNVKELVKNWLEYNRLQERIAAIEARRDQVKKAYSDELKAIAAGTGSMKEKVAAIRAAQRARDDNLQGLNDEQEKLEEQSAQYQEQMEHQKALIDAMNTQDDLLQRIVDTLKSLEETMKEIAAPLAAGAGGFGELGGMDMPDVSGMFEQADSEFMSLQERLTAGRGALQGLLDAWHGNPINMEGLNEDSKSLYMQLYNIGSKAREIADTVAEWWGKAKEFGAAAKEALGNIKLPELGKMGLSFDMGAVKEKLQPLLNVLKTMGDLFKSKLQPIMDAFRSAWDRITESFNKAFPSMDKTVASLKTIGGTILAILGGVVMGVIGGVLTALPTLIEGLGTVIAGILQFIGGALTFIADLINMWIAVFKGDWDGVAEYFRSWWEALGVMFEGALMAIIGFFTATFGTIIMAIWGFIQSVIEFFKGLWYELVGGSIIPDMLAQMVAAFAQFILDILTSIGQWVLDMVAKIVELKDNIIAKFQELITTLTELLAEISLLLLETFEEWRASAELKAQELYETVVDKIEQIGAWIEEKASAFISWGQEIVENIIEGIENMGGALYGALKDIVESAIEKIKRALGLSTGGSTGTGGTSKTEMLNPWSSMQSTMWEVQGLLTAIVSPGLSAAAVGGAGFGGDSSVGSTYNVSFDFSNSVVRSDRDIDEIVNKVVRKLGASTTAQINYGGKARF